jgi:hypothetical protein
MGIVMAVTVFLAFAGTYFVRSHFEGRIPGPMPVLRPLLHAHAIAFSSWVVLFILQTWFIANRKIKWHQRFGVAGAVLAGVMVALGIMITTSRIAMIPHPGHGALVFLFAASADMLTFGLLAFAAVALRRNPEWHKQLMVLAYIGLMPAATARIGHIAGGNILPSTLIFGLTDVFLLLAIGYDWFSRRKVHPAYLWGGLFLVAGQPLRFVFAGSDLWLRVAPHVLAFWHTHVV